MGVGVFLSKFVYSDVGGRIVGVVDGKDVGDGLGGVGWWLVHDLFEMDLISLPE